MSYVSDLDLTIHLLANPNELEEVIEESDMMRQAIDELADLAVG